MPDTPSIRVGDRVQTPTGRRGYVSRACPDGRVQVVYDPLPGSPGLGGGKKAEDRLVLLKPGLLRVLVAAPTGWRAARDAA